MKPFFTLFILLAVPLVLSIVLLIVTASLVLQHFCRSQTSREALVFPYLTSWEEAA